MLKFLSLIVSVSTLHHDVHFFRSSSFKQLSWFYISRIYCMCVHILDQSHDTCHLFARKFFHHIIHTHKVGEMSRWKKDDWMDRWMKWIWWIKFIFSWWMLDYWVSLQVPVYLLECWIHGEAKNLSLSPGWRRLISSSLHSLIFVALWLPLELDG